MMRFRPILSMIVAGLGLSGCVTTRQPPLQAINAPAIENVQLELKRQLAVYIARARAARKAEASAPKVPTWCGDGSIDYEVVSVKVDLTIARDDTRSAKAGLKIPMVGGSIGPNASGNSMTSNTQELEYNLYMLPDEFQPDELNTIPTDTKAPIADIMMAEREALIKAAQRTNSNTSPQPCLTNFDKDKTDAATSTITIGLKLTDEGSAGVDVDLGIVSFGATTDTKSSSGNTIAVTFRQAGLPKTVAFKPCSKEHPKWACPNPADPDPKGQATPAGMKTVVVLPVGQVKDILRGNPIDIDRLFGDKAPSTEPIPPAAALGTKARAKPKAKPGKGQTSKAAVTTGTMSGKQASPVPANCSTGRQTGVLNCPKTQGADK